MEPLRIAYLAEDASLSGGLRVVLGQADALVGRGHSVTIISKSQKPDWRATSAEWVEVTDFSEVSGHDYDFVIGTFWTTVRAAWELAGKRALHLCQGYEGDFTAYQPMRTEIESVYRLPVTKLVVSPHLVETCRRFTDDVEWVGQIVDREFFGIDASDSPPHRVALVGAFEIDFKGIDIGYGAVSVAREVGTAIELVRISPWAPASGEPSSLAQEFHVELDTEQMAATLASCGTFLGPSRRDEGFGLPAVEAMALGVPAVLTSIPSFLSFAAGSDHALFAPEDDASGLARQLTRAITDAPLRARLREAGRRVAAQFAGEKVAERMEKVMAARRA